MCFLIYNCNNYNNNYNNDNDLVFNLLVRVFGLNQYFTTSHV